MTNRLVYSPEEARRLLNLGRSTIYEALRAGTIPSIRVGRKYLIPVDMLHRFLGAAGPDDRVPNDGRSQIEPSEAGGKRADEVESLRQSLGVD